MLNNLDDVIQHYGVKGMKWGVRRDKPARLKARREARRKRNKARTEKLQKRHGKRMRKSDTYKKEYKRANKRYSHETSMRMANSSLRSERLGNALRLGVTAYVSAPVIKEAAKVGGMAAGIMYKNAATQSNIIKGKNLWQAIKRSPVRYADKSKYKDVVDMS